MKRFYFIPLLVLIGSVAFLLSVPLPSVAASFSGKNGTEADFLLLLSRVQTLKT